MTVLQQAAGLTGLADGRRAFKAKGGRVFPLFYAQAVVAKRGNLDLVQAELPGGLFFHTI